MRFTVFLILTAILIAAPLVDAIACDECNDFIPLRDIRERSMLGANGDVNLLSSEADRPASRQNGAARDLCPVCANSAAAFGNSCSGVPFMLTAANRLPKLIALSDPSYSINKPPQN